MAKSNTSPAHGAGSEPAMIDAMPTKELFIDMLTRDIGLIPAIIDLADNSADSARKTVGDGRLDGYWVRLNISPDEFRVADNCGGMTVDVARKYAFRFGRPPGAPSVKHSVGQFGVGMKRAIFKMGRQFRVESTTATSRFVVDVDVNQWAALPKWEFGFAEHQEDKKFLADAVGTVISVEDLRPDVREVFGLQAFENELRAELAARLHDPISRGLAVTLNGTPVGAAPLTMLANEELAPAFHEVVYKSQGKSPVSVKIYCGLGRSANKSDEREEAGWHVFCNGRLILQGDKSELTGWGEEADALTIPGFHGQYNHFRGFVYFDSDDPSRLPWNTTKTGLNVDSPVYRASKRELMRLMRPVIDFLNRLKDEKQAKEDPKEKGPLETLVESSKVTPVEAVKTRDLFTAPAPRIKPKVEGQVQRIQYDVPVAEAAAVKMSLKAGSWKEVGEQTFKYYYNAEVE